MERAARVANGRWCARGGLLFLHAPGKLGNTDWMGQTGRLCQEFFFLFGVPEVRRIDNGTEGKTPPPGEAWWVVRLSPRSLPIVLLKMPWQDGQQVSTTGNLGPAVAEVYGTSSCPIPNWTWNWVLTQAGVILAVLQTSVCLVFGKMLGNTFSFSYIISMP